MSIDADLEIRKLTNELLEDVVSMHLAGMGYTLNAKLGRSHLRRLYEAMSSDPTCFVGVAISRERPVGVISGSVDAGRFALGVLRRMHPFRLLRLGVAMLLRPRLIWLLFQGNSIAAPVYLDSAELRAVLTAIVVDPGTQRKGVGRALVSAFEDFLRQAHVQAYRLDTQIANEHARRFYGGLGFEEVARRMDSVVLVRRLAS